MFVAGASFGYEFCVAGVGKGVGLESNLSEMVLGTWTYGPFHLFTEQVLQGGDEGTLMLYVSMSH